MDFTITSMVERLALTGNSHQHSISESIPATQYNIYVQKTVGGIMDTCYNCNAGGKTMKRILILLTAVLLILLAGCGQKYENLESYVESNEEYQQEINDMAKTNDIDVDIKGNDMTLTYDFGKMDKSDLELYSELIDQYGKDLGKDMAEIVDQIESESHIEGVKVKVVFKANDKTIWEDEFTDNED